MDTVADYLSRLDAALPLPVGQRHRIVAEVSDGLHCAIERGARSGMDVGQAERAAVAEFGDPVRLAAQFTQALAPGMARRVGLALVVTGPMVGLAWLAGIGHGVDWTSRLSSVLSALPYFPVILAVTVPAAIVAVLRGSVSLRRNISSRGATLAARLACSGCLLADTVLIASAAGGLQSGRFTASAWITLAFGLSALRWVGAANATWRLARLRVAGY